MGHYKNFETVVYCVANWTDEITREQLEKEYVFFDKYVGVDKVYLEAFRDHLASKEQVRMVKRFFEEKGVKVSGGITTVTADLVPEDEKRQRLFNTFCFSNEGMRNHLQKMVEYTAEEFDEFIIDDFFFTQCTCEDCIREKGDRSWEEFRLEKMKEVSENLVIRPAKAVNPNISITIKYPNWAESYQETGYHPRLQREMFDKIYTGTETRSITLQDQHLPRYLSYSLVRYMEHVLPGKNGGGWFDPYECYQIDQYLEQMYLTAFSKAREIMHFCWGSLYDSKYATGLGFQLGKIDEILSHTGEPTGLPVYIPFEAQGDDHAEDYLGMLGIPLEPMPDFPEEAKAVMLTAASLKDETIIDRLKAFVAAGATAVVTSGFMIQALETGRGIEEMTSIRYRGRRLEADEFHVITEGLFEKCYATSKEKISWPFLEHRNNATWSLINAGHQGIHGGILFLDTYGKGKLLTLNLPDMYAELQNYPKEALKKIRYELMGNGKVYLDAPANISLFTYDNRTFGIYCYACQNTVPADIEVHICEEVECMVQLPDRKEIPVLCRKSGESIFTCRIEPGSFQFYQW